MFCGYHKQQYFEYKKKQESRNHPTVVNKNKTGGKPLKM
jgi:hypothetical protein